MLKDSCNNSFSKIDINNCDTIIELMRLRNNELQCPLNRLEIDNILTDLCVN